jgi:hypothetical protein
MDTRIIRQLLLFLFIIACTVSVVVTGRFTVREILDAAISFAFVPVVELVGFALAWRLSRQTRTFNDATRMFVRGNFPWMFWCLGVMVAGWLVSPAQENHIPGAYRSTLLYGTAAAVFLWSLTIDLKYLRDVLNVSSGEAMRLVATQRLVSWGSGAVYFYSFAIPPFLMRIVS